jgi:hypothetical protein
MKTTLSILTFAAFAAAVPVQASIYSVNFTGNVEQTLGATGQSVGNVVTGHFDVDSTTGNFLDFTIAGQSVAPGFQSSLTIGPAETDAIYTAQISPVSSGGTSNDSFTLDLSSLTNWPSTDPYALLLNTSQLKNNLDTANNPASAFPSTFSYYIANSNGTNLTTLTVNLTSINATAPEPATLALTASSLLAAALAKWGGRQRLRRTSRSDSSNQ